MLQQEAEIASARYMYVSHWKWLPWISCQSRSNSPMPDLRDQSDGIQDVGFGARETQEAMNEMTTLLREMVVLLRDMNQRQAILGMWSIALLALSLIILRSDQPVPQGEARNSGAWRALGKSQAEIMEPTIERWKGGLDVMLVFVCATLYSNSLDVHVLIIAQRLVSSRQS